MEKSKSVVLEPFMVEKLHLNGNELVMYAILWAESDGGQQATDCNHSYLAAKMGVALPTAYNVVKSLTKKGYIAIKEKGICKIVKK